MTDYDDDKVRLLRAREELRRRYLKQVTPSQGDADPAGGLISGPQTTEELEKLIKELEADDQDDDDQGDGHER